MYQREEMRKDLVGENEKKLYKKYNYEDFEYEAFG